MSDAMLKEMKRREGGVPPRCSYACEMMRILVTKKLGDVERSPWHVEG